jgi:hypothetical protein
VVPALRDALDRLEASPCPSPSAFARAATRLRVFYEQIVKEPWFPTALVAVFGVFALATIAEIIFDARKIWDGKESAHVIAVAATASSLIASGLIGVGILKLRTSRIAAYRCSRMIPWRSQRGRLSPLPQWVDALSRAGPRCPARRDRSARSTSTRTASST